MDRPASRPCAARTKAASSTHMMLAVGAHEWFRRAGITQMPRLLSGTQCNGVTHSPDPNKHGRRASRRTSPGSAAEMIMSSSAAPCLIELSDQRCCLTQPSHAALADARRQNTPDLLHLRGLPAVARSSHCDRSDAESIQVLTLVGLQRVMSRLYARPRGQLGCCRVHKQRNRAIRVTTFLSDAVAVEGIDPPQARKIRRCCSFELLRHVLDHTLCTEHGHWMEHKPALVRAATVTAGHNVADFWWNPSPLACLCCYHDAQCPPLTCCYAVCTAKQSYCLDAMLMGFRNPHLRLG